MASEEILTVPYFLCEMKIYWQMHHEKDVNFLRSMRRLAFLPSSPNVSKHMMCLLEDGLPGIDILLGFSKRLRASVV